MKILVINAGSSSLKYQMIDMETRSMIVKGICERIGFEDSLMVHTTHKGHRTEKKVFIKDHIRAFHLVKDALMAKENGVINNLNEIDAVGHRVVQGGPVFTRSCIITADVTKEIEKLIPLAPLHNKAHVEAIRACFEVLGDRVPEVAVFDTSFHSTMPPESYIYPIPYEYYEKYHIRKYGFHGISHSYVSSRYCHLTGKSLDSLKMITCHLGNGSSIAAIQDGKVIDTSMGLTPLEGLTMGTRSGSIDPSIIIFLQQLEGICADEVSKILNKKSGLLGISGISSDIRDLVTASRSGNSRATLAQNIFKQDIIKFIGSYIALMGGVDAIIFTAGIGENQVDYREDICKSFSYMGLTIDQETNKKTFAGKESRISRGDSTIDVFVIPTNEELTIATETLLTIRNHL